MSEKRENNDAIFIVEHSDKTRKTLADFFSKKGFFVEEADTVDSALDKSKTNSFTCIVTAIDFPNIDSLKYLQNLHHLALETPIVALSSNTNISKAVETLQQGAFYLVQKPILVMEVANAVEEAISSKQQKQKLIDLSQHLCSESLFEVPGSLGQIESLIDYLAEETEQYEILPQNEDAPFRAALRCALHNAVIHGNQADESKLVKIRFALNSRGCDIEVTDQGKGFDPEAYINPSDLSSSVVKGQRGLLRIFCYMDSVSFNEKGNQIRMVKLKK